MVSPWLHPSREEHRVQGFAIAHLRLDLDCGNHNRNTYCSPMSPSERPLVNNSRPEIVRPASMLTHMNRASLFEQE